MSEIWKTIPGFSRYEASDKGNLRSLNYKKTGKTEILSPAVSGGYSKTVLLSDEGIYKSIKVHRIVLLTFLGDSHLEVNHIDGNKINNNLNNLEYCTHSENIKHAFRIGLEKNKKGEDSSSAKLTNNDVKEIRQYAELHGKLKYRKDLAKKYGVSESTLKDIVSRRRNNWSHI